MGLILLAELLILVVVFQAGVFVGVRKATFSFSFGDNYHRMFGGPRGGLLRDLAGKDLISGHGVSGVVVRVDGTTIVMKDSDNMERAIVVQNGVPIKSGLGEVDIANLQSDERIVVIGEPGEEGQIDAKFVRVLRAVPPPGLPVPFWGH